MPLNREAALVHERVMSRAEREHVVEGGFSAIRPVLNVVDIQEAQVPTARIDTAAISCQHGLAQRAGHDALLASDGEGVTTRIIEDRREAAIATESSHGR